MIQKFFHLLVLPLDFITKYFKALVFLLIVIVLLLSLTPKDSENSTPNLAKIYLYGPIFESEDTRTQIETILKNPSIKGVLLLINSPGGGLGASIEISDMIRELKTKMPVIAYVEGTMASGSYYAGMVADKIYANRGALIGSIGVIFNGMNIQNLANKIGIKSQSIAAGKYKEIGTFMREWTPLEKGFLQDLIQEEYQMFISDVASVRGLDPKDSQKYAEGKIFSASNALKLGLIDKIASQNEAIKALKDLTQVKEAIWLKKDKFEALMDKVIKGSTQIVLQAFSQQLQ
ncbi:signal peptide peptidase SppA [Helicobacter sp. 11S02596-1]|uniref:signal peptide peptidase SppA n=1 Tax=Helicobacter sp. 11S02596-1 TaxID=1476194 RepID=UPI000BA54D8F|nr:signal peptide peptidase SppA [Helicobacter sp. 11S02596-1]PAF44263.1 endopeptidase IV [Helicobacter sp. 11S02596-1]